MLLRWNSRGPKATLMPLWEWVGLHHRWNMFAHSPEDTAHAWYNVKYEIVVSDAAGVKDTFYVPPLNPSLFERYLNYRQFRFKNNFTVVKSAFGVPFSRYWAREYARKYSFVTYPIDVQVQTRFERLNPPGSLKGVGIEQRSIPYSGRFALSDLNCGESPR